MAERLTVEEVSRQPLILGTICFTDPSGTVGYKSEVVQASALVRIAAALEAQTELLRLLHAPLAPTSADALPG